MKIATFGFIALVTAFPVGAEEAMPVAGQTVLGVEVNVAAINANGYSANKLIGADVHNGTDDVIGSVHDLIVGVEGEVSLAILEVGGFLGLGSKWVAVPAHLFEADTNSKVVLADANEAALKAMPAFSYAN